MDPSQEFLVEDIFPTQELHVIGGPSGAGKTTWILQFIQDWQARNSIFGYASHPLPYVYVSCDRSERSLLRTFKRVGIEPGQLRYLAGLRLKKLDEVVAEARRRHPDTKVLFIEGFGRLCPPPSRNDGGYLSSTNFVAQIVTYLEDHDMTIFAVVHSPKAKKKDIYENPRQRVLGSVGWGAMVNGMVVIEPLAPDVCSPLRKVFLLPREAPERVFDFSFTDDGLLVELVNAADHVALDLWLRGMKLEEPFSTKNAITYAEKHDLSPSTAERWLRFKVEQGSILRMSKGLYKKAAAA